MKKEKNEAVSRRDFFKKAVKAALPIIAVTALASNPIVAKAAETAVTGCTGTCHGRCDGSCEGCYHTCKGTCSGSCKNTCHYSSK